MKKPNVMRKDSLIIDHRISITAEIKRDDLNIVVIDRRLQRSASIINTFISGEAETSTWNVDLFLKKNRRLSSVFTSFDAGAIVFILLCDELISIFGF